MSAQSVMLSESLEDYLETIYFLLQEGAEARSKDIAARLKVARPSVTGALQALAERDLVNYEPYGPVTLTAAGEKAARRVAQRHQALKNFFVGVLGVDAKEAEICACKMEHAVSKTIVERLVGFARFVETCPKAWRKQIRGFTHPCEGESASATETGEGMKQSIQKVNGRIMKLNQLKPGEKGRIEKLLGTGAVKQRIADMGISRGATVEVVRVAPLGDPMDVRIRGYHLSLRKGEAAQIEVEKLEKAAGK